MYIMAISINRASLDLWRKENLLKHQKVSRHYRNDCLQNFLLVFMSLWADRIVLKQTWKFSNTKFRAQWKDWKCSYQVRQILAVCCSLISLILASNCLKGIRVIKVFKEIKFECVLDEWQPMKCFQRELFPKYLRLFPCKIAHYGKTLISAFQEFFANSNKMFIFAGTLGTRQSFYEV